MQPTTTPQPPIESPQPVPFGQRIGRRVEPVRINGKIIAPYVVAIVLGVLVIVSSIMAIAEYMAR